MGCGNPNNEGNPLFPLKQTQEAALAGKESEAALAGKESEAALTGKVSEAALTGKESEAEHTGKVSEAALTGKESEAEHTGKGSEAEVTGKGSEAPDSSQIFHVNNTPAFTSFPFSLPNSHLGNVHGIHQSYAQDPRIFNNIPGLMGHGFPQYVHSLRGNLSNQYTRPSGVNHPPPNMNFVPNPFTVSGDYYRNAHVVEGQASDVNQSQITVSSPYSGCNQPVTQSTRGTFANNDANVGASYPGNIDGSFLTLGAGGYILGGSSSFQRIPAGLPGSISSNTIQSSHVPQVCEQYERNDRNLGIRSVPLGTYQGNSPYNHHYQGDPASAFLSSSNVNSSNIHPGFGPASSQTSESAKLMGSNFQTTPGQPPNYHVRNVRDATSVFGSNSINVTGVPVTQDHLGRWISAVQGSMTQAIGGGYSGGGQPTGRLFSASGVNSATPHRSIPIAGNPLPQTVEATTTTVSGTVGSFPRRLGAQPVDGRQSVYRVMDPRVMGAQTRSKGGVNQSQHFQITRNVHESAAGTGTGHSQGALPHQLVQQQLLSSGPEPVITQAHQVSRMSNVAISQPSHKRAAVDPSIVASLSQRRKLLHDSMAARLHGQRRGITTTIQPHIPSETRISRQQGSELHVKPLGHQCFLCRRDLLFTPEGPISQPRLPPTAAVLPCGHTFHDHCLQKITSEEQAKDPTCFACIEDNERTEGERQESK